MTLEPSAPDDAGWGEADGDRVMEPELELEDVRIAAAPPSLECDVTVTVTGVATEVNVRDADGEEPAEVEDLESAVTVTVTGAAVG